VQRRRKKNTKENKREKIVVFKVKRILPEKQEQQILRPKSRAILKERAKRNFHNCNA
jgi:hypothetical protein